MRGHERASESPTGSRRRRRDDHRSAHRRHARRRRLRSRHRFERHRCARADRRQRLRPDPERPAHARAGRPRSLSGARAGTAGAAPPLRVHQRHVGARRLPAVHGRREGAGAHEAVRHDRAAARCPGDTDRLVPLSPVGLLTNVPPLTNPRGALARRPSRNPMLGRVVPWHGACSPDAVMQKALAMWLMLAAGGGSGQPDATPTQVVQTATDQVLTIVQDSQLAAPIGQDRRRAEVQRIAERLFDFQEMARRALALHWRERSPQEQTEFVAVFKQLLARAYIGRLEGYAGEQVVYLGETVEAEFATVRSKIVTGRGAEIGVDYRLHLVGSRWMVYDVAVQGVSFVANYRGQFDRIIRASSYQALVRELKSK